MQLTVQNKRDIERLRRAWSQDLLRFTRITHPGYLAGAFHKDVARRLEQFSRDVEQGLSPRLILQAPPRHGKSTLASERFPLWHLCKNPHHDVVVASYGLQPAQDRAKNARDCALNYTAQALFPNFAVRRDTWAKANWQVDNAGLGGHFFAVGRGGPLTSRGAHVLILDDLVKDYEQAHSALQRDTDWNWYLSTAYTRLAKGGGILCVMTRWHEDDIAGRMMLEQADENWEVVSYPAIATHDEQFRQAGEALHPERYDLDDLRKIRQAVGPVVFEALYQQNPTTPGGAVWQREWWQYYETRPQCTSIIQSWDLTFKETGSSYVVGLVLGKAGGDYYVLDEIRGRWGFVDTVARLRAAVKRWPRTGRILIEDRANGPAVIDALRSELGGKLLAVQPDGSKVARAHACSGLIEAGKVYLPEHEKWTRPFVDECSQFPAGPNDDRVDALSQGLRYLSKPRTVFVGRL